MIDLYLSKDPERQPLDAAELATALGAWQKRDPVKSPTSKSVKALPP